MILRVKIVFFLVVVTLSLTSQSLPSPHHTTQEWWTLVDESSALTWMLLNGIAMLASWEPLDISLYFPIYINLKKEDKQLKWERAAKKFERARESFSFSLCNNISCMEVKHFCRHILDSMLLSRKCNRLQPRKWESERGTFGVCERERAKKTCSCSCRKAKKKNILEK